MKKIALLIVITVFVLSCKSKINYYEGYICNMDKKPLSKVKVCKMHKLNEYSITDEKGFFRINKALNFIDDLIVFYDEKPIDTIRTVWSQHGEKIIYSFLEGKNDTLFIDISKYGK